MIREDPAVRSSCVRGRGTETSAEVLVGPPWRMESGLLKFALLKNYARGRNREFYGREPYLLTYLLTLLAGVKSNKGLRNVHYFSPQIQVVRGQALRGVVMAEPVDAPVDELNLRGGDLVEHALDEADEPR